MRLSQTRVNVPSCGSRATAAFALAVAIRALGADGAWRFFEPVQPPRRIQIIAQQGEARQAPANSRPALTRCAEDGIEWAAVDVRVTRDGHHLLVAGERVPDGSGRLLTVAEASLEELRQLDVGTGFAAKYAGQRLLSLGEALALARGSLNLYLECRAVNPERLAREILTAGMERQVAVGGPAALLSELHSASGGRLALVGRPLGRVAMRSDFEPESAGEPDALQTPRAAPRPIRSREAPGVRGFIPAFRSRSMEWWPRSGDVEDWALSNHLAAVELEPQFVTPELCAALHGRGVKVAVMMPGELDRPEAWEQMMAAGVDWIRTALPEEVRVHAYQRTTRVRPVRMSLHRGALRYAPENTLPAFEKALRLGADLVEFDVRTTRDGRYYLLHDGRLDRTTNGSGPIQDATSGVVEPLSAGAGFSPEHRETRLPTLDLFLDTFAGRVDFYLDAKEIPPETLAAVLERHGVVERTVVYQSPGYLQRLKAINPAIRLLPPLNAAAELEPLAAALKPYGVDVAWEALSRELIARCHELGVRVYADALGRHERVEAYLEAMDWGIDVIQTDHPLRLLRAMELRRLRDEVE